MTIEGITGNPAFADDAPDVCRELFPALSGCCYLDTGSGGVSPCGQGRRVASFYECADPSRIGYRLMDHWLDRANHLRATLALLLGVPATEIEFLSGTTEALNTVSQSLTWHPGDEVAFAEDDFASITQAWQSAVRAGAALRPFHVADEAERTEALIAALTPRTRVLTASHVHSVRGTRIDLDRIGRACRANGTLFGVDGIHALGATPADLRQVDVYVSGTFKWLLSGFGVGIAVLRPTARAQMRPGVRGYRNRLADQSYEYAHLNYSSLYALECAIEIMGGTIGWDLVHARTAHLVQCLADEMEAIGLPLVAPPGARAGVATMRVGNADALKQALDRRGIHVAAKGEYLRASPFFYNSREDISRFSQAMKELT